MAGALTEKQLANCVYESLQAVSCPLVHGLYLQEDETKLEFLCSNSELRTDLLVWLCNSINPNICSSKTMSVRSKDPDALVKEMAGLGQELMLSKADDLDLIKGEACPLRQLRFLEQLLTLVPGCKKAAVDRTDEDALLTELFAAENLPFLSQTLQPELNPWPSHIRALRKGTKLSNKPREEFEDVSDLLQSAQSQLELLKSKSELPDGAEASASSFSPSSLRLAAGDLLQLMKTFSHVFETNLRVYCHREAPKMSSDIEVFQRVQRQLLACNTELEMLQELLEASASVSQVAKQLKTQRGYWSREEKRTLPDHLEELTRQIGNALPRPKS